MFEELDRGSVGEVTTRASRRARQCCCRAFPLHGRPPWLFGWVLASGWSVGVHGVIEGVGVSNVSQVLGEQVTELVQ